VVIHGKPRHEETRATFSHSVSHGHSVIVRDMEDAQRLAAYIYDNKSREDFDKEFEGKYSAGFDPQRDLVRIGVVNQTTMLATETQAIADYFRQAMIDKYGVENLKQHFADTRDTLCYATNDNQDATYRLLETDADLALVVGGYNSSNTSHIVELCERKFSTYFINSENEIKSADEIHHFNYHQKQKLITKDFLPEKKPVKIILTSGASCPDTLVDKVMLKILSFYPEFKPVEEVLAAF
jgi:4-hydroxy-3-methylbut-2-enyl diphosphate reductase